MDIDAAQSRYTHVLDGGLRILVVDDDPIAREFAIVYLATPGAEVSCAPDAETGLEMLRAGRYDIALLDIDMPGMDGIELARILRADASFRDLIIVMVTGRDDIVSIDRAYAAGATSFVQKPVNWRILSYHLKFLTRASKIPNLA